jgi:hypothetical protein
MAAKSNNVRVECVCGSKYEVDRAQVKEFECEACKRRLEVPPPAMAEELTRIRIKMQQGPPGMRDAARRAAELRSAHALPLLKVAAESGVREAVNASLVGLVDFAAGQELLREWIRSGTLSVSRLITAIVEEHYEKGVDFVCNMISKGNIKESQLAEVAPWLGKTGSQRALDTLREARRRYSNLGGILDDAMANLRDLDETAGSIPEEAKMIPGRPSGAEPLVPPKKGCMGLLLAPLIVVGMVVVVITMLV